MNISIYNDSLVHSTRIIYSPTDFARSALLYLQEIGTLSAQKKHASSHQDLASYLLIIVTAGSGTLSYMGKKYTLSRGDCAFINCENDYYHESSEDLWTLQWIHFQGVNAPELYTYYLEQGGPIIFHPGDLQPYSALWDSIYQIAQAEDKLRDLYINESLARLWTLLMQKQKNRVDNQVHPEDSTLFLVKEFLEQNYVQKITLNQLSEKFYISKYSLSRQFHEKYGLTLSDYLLRLRIAKAKELLRFSDLHLDEISERCGITPQYYFSRVFKDSEGMSPSDFRKRWM